ncbi:hypothetical protein X975_03331, partial [Stegodyphus mimosarum]
GATLCTYSRGTGSSYNEGNLHFSNECRSM